MGKHLKIWYPLLLTFDTTMVHPLLAALPTRPTISVPSYTKEELKNHELEFFFSDTYTHEPIRTCVGFPAFLRGGKTSESSPGLPFGCFSNLNVMQRWVMMNTAALGEGVAAKLMRWIKDASGDQSVQPAPPREDLVAYGGKTTFEEYHKQYKHAKAPENVTRNAFQEWSKRQKARKEKKKKPTDSVKEEEMFYEQVFNLHRHITEEAKKVENQNTVLSYQLCYYPPLEMWYIERLNSRSSAAHNMTTTLEGVLKDRFHITSTLPRKDALQDSEVDVILPLLTKITQKRALKQLGGVLPEDEKAIAASPAASSSMDVDGIPEVVPSFASSSSSSAAAAVSPNPLMPTPEESAQAKSTKRKENGDQTKKKRTKKPKVDAVAPEKEVEKKTE